MKITLTELEKALILQKQLELAAAGSESMLIHLGKTYLEQNTKILIEPVNNLEKLTHEELKKLLQERLLELEKTVEGEVDE